jgi:hypothetical protein
MNPSGLTLADYYHWTPKTDSPAGMLDRPAACDKNSFFEPGSAADFGSDCGGCHVTSGP